MMAFNNRFLKIISFRRYLLPLFFMLLLGFFLRLYKLNANSFWFDECMPFVTPTEYVNNALFSWKFYCPVIFDAFIHYFSKLVGYDDLLLRMTSVLPSIASVLAFYYLGKLLFGRKVGLFSAFILAISPFHIYYAQEIRMYSFISLFSILSACFFIKALIKDKNRYWAGFVVFSLINIYLHPFIIFIQIAMAAFFLFYIKRYRHLIGKWIRAHILILIFLIPWIISAARVFIFMLDKDNWFFRDALSWRPQVAWSNLFYTFKNFSIGYNAPRQIYLFSGLFFSVLFLLGIRPDRKSEGRALSLLSLFVPIISVYFLSKFRPCYVDRYFIPSSLFYYLIIGRGLSCLQKKYIVVAMLCIMSLSFSSLRNYYANHLPGLFAEHVAVQTKKEHQEVAKYLAENLKEGDIVFHTCRNTVLPFEYYFGNIYGSDISIEKNLVLRFSENRDTLLPFEYTTEFNRFIYRSQDLDFGWNKRIWVIFSAWDYELRLGPRSLESKVIQRMDQRYFKRSSKVFSGITVYLYEIR